LAYFFFITGGRDHFDSATPFYTKLKILKLSDLNKIEVAKSVHNFIYNNLRSTFFGNLLIHVNTPFAQQDFPLMETAYTLFHFIKQVGCNVASNIKESLFVTSI